MVRAPRRAGRRDEQVAKLDRAQAGAAAQLPARDLLRGHGESFRVRVRGMPGVPVASARAEAGWEPPGVRPRPGAARSPAPLSRAWADLSDRRSAGRLAPCAHWSGCVCSAAFNFSRIPLASPGRASWHPGAGGEESEGRESPGWWELVGWARGGQSPPEGAAALAARGVGSTGQVRRDLSAWDPEDADQGGVSGEGTTLGPEE